MYTNNNGVRKPETNNSLPIQQEFLSVLREEHREVLHKHKLFENASSLLHPSLFLEVFLINTFANSRLGAFKVL